MGVKFNKNYNKYNILKQGLKFYADGANAFVDVRDVAAIIIKLYNNKIERNRIIHNFSKYKYASDRPTSYYSQQIYTMSLKGECPKRNKPKYLKNSKNLNILNQ